MIFLRDIRDEKSVPPSVTEKEAAAILRVSVATLQRWRWLGTGPVFVKAGARVTYDPADLAAWRDARKRCRTNGGRRHRAVGKD